MTCWSDRTGHWRRCIRWCSSTLCGVKIRDEGTVKNKAVFLALGIQCDGTRDVLGLWIQQTEGAKFWLAVVNDLKHRGVEDILIAVIDRLKGFPEAITAVFPEAEIQTCIVLLMRTSLSFCNWKERQPVARELKRIYNTESVEVAANLEIRKIIYTTNAIESLHMQLRKVLKNRGHFPNDEAATKLIYLALRNITKKWKNPPVIWKLAATQFAIQFGERFFAADVA
jgi:putative transposase